jgi:hypothetical protein
MNLVICHPSQISLKLPQGPQDEPKYIYIHQITRIRMQRQELTVTEIPNEYVYKHKK